MFDLSNSPKDSKFFDPIDEKVIGKMKDVPERKIDDEFGLKSKMHSMKNLDGKESNMAKRATEFNEFKNTLFNKKVIQTKNEKNIKLNHTKSTKYHYYVLMIKDLF